MKILLVRHGETDFNKGKKIQGHSDIELNQTGEEQAINAAKKIENFNIDYAYSSPLKRAERTARLMLDNSANDTLSITCDERLIEKFFGDFEGATFEEYFTALETKEKLETVESDEELFKRTEEFFSSCYAAHKGETILVVCHGALIRTFLRTLGLYPDTDRIVDNTGLNILNFDGKNFTLEEFNI